MLYNLKLTSREVGQIQYDVFDLCNFDISGKYTQKQMEMDPNDMGRILIYPKLKKLSKTHSIFEDLTADELNFIAGEIEAHNHSGRESCEKGVSVRILNKIDKLKDVQLQRDSKIEWLINNR